MLLCRFVQAQLPQFSVQQCEGIEHFQYNSVRELSIFI
jgi:hypothetical protein